MADKTKGRGRQKGLGSIYKEKNRFYLKMRAEGVSKTFLLRNEDDTPCTTRKEAELAAARLNTTTLELDTREKMIERVAEVRQLKRENTFSMSDIWETFIKAANRPDAGEAQTKTQKAVLERFTAWLAEKGVNSVSDIDASLADQYMAELGQIVSNKTFNEYLTMLRSIFSYVLKPSGLRENPFDGIRRRKAEMTTRKEFTEEQVKAIFDGFHNGFFENIRQEGLDGHGGRLTRTVRHEFKPMHKEELEVLLKLCCYSGCDGQSGCLMRWEGIDLNNNTISYVRLKTRKATGGKVVTLPIHPILREALETALTWRGESPFVLPNIAERYQRNADGIRKDVMKVIHCALGVEVTNRDTGAKRAKAANVYSLHSFRHTFVSFCANAGVPLAVVAAIVGHGSPAMTRHYSHISDEAKSRAIASLPDIKTQDEPRDITEEAERMKARDLMDTLPIEKIREILNQYGK